MLLISYLEVLMLKAGIVTDVIKYIYNSNLICIYICNINNYRYERANNGIS